MPEPVDPQALLDEMARATTNLRRLAAALVESRARLAEAEALLRDATFGMDEDLLRSIDAFLSAGGAPDA